MVKGIVVSQTGGPDVLSYQEMDKPEIKGHQLRIKVKAASVNFADIKMRNGTYPGTQTFPFTPGLDASGIVEKTGADVTAFKEGDLVAAFAQQGSYAEYIAVDEALTFPLPSTSDPEKAVAFLTAGFAAYDLIHKMASLQPQDTLLVHAASGGVGTAAVQFAKLAGCTRIIATVGSDFKKDIAKNAGADEVINYSDQDFSKVVLEKTEGRGVDVILDSIGGEVFRQNMDCLASFGRLVYFGNAGGGKAKVDISELYPSSRSVLGYSLGKLRKNRPREVQKTAAEALPFLQDDRFSMMISRTMSLQDAYAAHELMENRESLGKILLVP